jgi:hypothetical protein
MADQWHPLAEREAVRSKTVSVRRPKSRRLFRWVDGKSRFQKLAAHFWRGLCSAISLPASVEEWGEFGREARALESAVWPPANAAIAAAKINVTRFPFSEILS